MGQAQFSPSSHSRAHRCRPGVGRVTENLAGAPTSLPVDAAAQDRLRADLDAVSYKRAFQRLTADPTDFGLRAPLITPPAMIVMRSISANEASA